MKIKTLVPWYGSNRMLASEVGRLLKGCEWVGIPFVGGCSELAEINARTIVANDAHQHLINLARVVRDAGQCELLVARLHRSVFHETELELAQDVCRRAERGEIGLSEPADAVTWALCFFVCCWMSRSETAETKSEFDQSLSVRWSASGGDSAVRFRSAVDGLGAWAEVFARRNLTFTCRDAFDFLGKCKDQKGHGIYCDPPFPGAGQRYAHAPSKGEEAEWHRRLRDRLDEFDNARIVVRYHANELVDDLYADWERVELVGRAQTNAVRSERLCVRRGNYGCEGRGRNLRT